MLIMTNGLIFQSTIIPQEKKDTYGILMIAVLMVIVIITGSRVVYSVLRSLLKAYTHGKTVPALPAVGSDTIPREEGIVTTSGSKPVALDHVPSILQVQSVRDT
jgi:hypothetical protein